ncbi:hypothetical protein MGN70_003299 [Eutypa lata]|uniref:Small secreted protein n=1 Tax=Eutypa lata (strain UCR-EL1) TaxID=1287681 RepID=M7SA90_EUTLA|nr:hypothetical protein UCREL1_9995 [Eutypa lata UCREL1]KAI1255235.1 hypothetical protein MGN70_003299 [Eutypa lata]
MQFSTTFNAIMALALGSNAASINARQEPMVASINTYNTAECSDLPQNGIELLSESVGKCGSYEWELLGVMPYIFESNCTFTVYSGADCSGTSTDVDSFICAESGESYKLTC